LVSHGADLSKSIE
jgi:hypothetical protein